MPLSSGEKAKWSDALAGAIVEGLFADEVTVTEWAERLALSLPDGPDDLGDRLRARWEKRNAAVDSSHRREIDHPIVLLRGYGNDAPDERIRALIPEEKIIVNRKVFRDVLDEVDFAKADALVEKSLLARLKTESIGLSDQEIFLYYTLIKLSRSPAPAEKAGESAAHSPADVAKIVLASVTRHFGDPCRLGNANDGKEIPPNVLATLFAQKVAHRKPTVPVAFAMAGAWSSQSRPILLVKTFLQLMAAKWDSDFSECQRYYGAFFLMSGTDVAGANLSRVLASFLRGESTRLLKPVMSATIQFLHNFSQTLAMQAVEINRKYQASPEDVKQKLVKLYAAPDRRVLLLNNAASNAFQTLTQANAEALEISKVWKSFAPKLPAFLTAEDLFGVDYSSTPSSQVP